MYLLRAIAIVLLLSGLGYLSGCNRPQKFKTAWVNEFSRLGSSSSIRCVDLNNDGVLDVIIGASENEFQPSDSSVLALDGNSGEVLWSVFAKDQIVGSAAFLDVTGDAIPEVFIGGRGTELMAINGASGETVWRFAPSEDTPVLACCLRFNFYNPQVIPDQDGDGLADLLVSNGGNVEAKPYSNEKRFPGVLAVFNSKTGILLAADTMPDGKETYMSPVVHDFSGGELSIVFGTGGETLGGNLFRVPLKDLMSGNISGAEKLASAEGYGFIAPPTLADVTTDGVKDIIVNWFGGKMIALDGSNGNMLWERPVPDTEVYSIPVPGFFTDDNIPDFFSAYNIGQWPQNKGTIQLLIDGKNGSILFSDSIGCMGYASAITADLNGDGRDEVIWSTNEFNCNPPSFVGPDLMNDQHSLQLLNYQTKELRSILPPIKAKNISTTPWIGDLDQDGYLDLVYCIQRNTDKVVEYRGMRVDRISTNIKISAEPTWGAYMGNDGTGVFSADR